MPLGSDDKPLARRRFFREGLGELLRPLAKAFEPMQKVAQQLADLDQPAPEPVRQPELHWLRPPGALFEQQFRDQCQRSGECVRVCPAKAIKLDYGGVRGEGVPYIDPDEMPCVMCTGLFCMTACPSGAIQQALPEYIDMGVAVWKEHYCLRSSGDNCTICIDRCPVGARALTLVVGKVSVKEGCTGCGVCQHDCPTSPKSIVITPKSAR
jgi:ferredoxin-type protein NapG